MCWWCWFFYFNNAHVCFRWAEDDQAWHTTVLVSLVPQLQTNQVKHWKDTLQAASIFPYEYDGKHGYFETDGFLLHVAAAARRFQFEGKYLDMLKIAPVEVSQLFEATFPSKTSPLQAGAISSGWVRRGTTSLTAPLLWQWGHSSSSNLGGSRAVRIRTAGSSARPCTSARSRRGTRSGSVASLRRSVLCRSTPWRPVTGHGWRVAKVRVWVHVRVYIRVSRKINVKKEL